MIDDFDWKAFEKTEVERVLSEMEAIDKMENTAISACPNYSGEATVEAFEKAMNASIDIFAEKTKILR